MSTKDVFAKKITILAEVLPEGQRITAGILEYSRPIKNDRLAASQYAVDGRTITRVYSNTEPKKTEQGKDGQYVVIELSPNDADAGTFGIKGEGWDMRVYLRNIELKITQKADIAAADGSICLAQNGVFIGYHVESPLVDEFIHLEYQGLKYNLFIPKDYDLSKQYPLVFFCEDAGRLGEDARIALAQGIGATVWIEPEEQAKHACFVLAPQFPGPTLTHDDYTVTEELETAKKLIDYIVGRYNIDKNRIYATGQSMGFMCCSELNIRYPNLFAASLLFGGQWNPQTMPQLKDKKMWIVVSELNQRAFSNNNETMLNIEMAGTKVGRYWWDGRASQAEFTENVQEALQDGCNFRYSVLKGDSVLPEGKIAENPLAYHTNTWRVGYTIEALRDWLFTCAKA